MVSKLFTYQDSVNATFRFEFEVDISILATINEELATLRQQKISLPKNPTSPIVSAAHSSNIPQTLTTKFLPLFTVKCYIWLLADSV